MNGSWLKEMTNDGVRFILNGPHENIQMVESGCYQFWVKEHPINQQLFRFGYPQFLTSCLMQLETLGILKIKENQT